MTKFEDMGIVPEIVKGVQEMGFDSPMPIQEKVIPMLLTEKQDLVGLAQTGTGKTAAFGLPLVQLADPDNPKTQALILAPTRELCLQITNDLKNYAKHIRGLEVVAIYGGADMTRQINALRKKAQIIVATPGRMNDLLNRRKQIDLSQLQTVVLDEADEMLNMGFKEELDAILEKTPDTVRTLLFSATMPREVQRISKNYMHDPVEIMVGARNAGAENISHVYYTVRSKDRYLALKRIVDDNPSIYGIVFCRTRLETKEVADKLIQDQYNADALHGDLSQSQREYIMHRFRIKNLQILVATDVAARGLDVKDITHIINYNLPDESDTYVHRSGRTGRAGKKGVSVAIVNLKEKYKIKRIESKLKKKFTTEPIPGGKRICEKQVLNLVDKLQKIEVDHKEIDPFLPAVFEELKWLSREDIIKHFVSLEFNRFLDYYKDVEDLNIPETKSGLKKTFSKETSPKLPGQQAAEAGYSRFFINLGFKDSLTPKDMIGLIIRCTRKKHIDIGRIDLMKTFSFFEVDQAYTSAVLNGFHNIEYKRKAVVVELTKKEETPQKIYPRKKSKFRKAKPKWAGKKR